MSLARIKAELLSGGVRLSEAFLKEYGPPFLEKRRAYGNTDPLELRNALVPQEMYLLPERLICAVNIRNDATWLLDKRDDFVVVSPEGEETKVTFPLRPEFYNYEMNDGGTLQQVVTLYGGGSLGFFVYGHCDLVDNGGACQYCSIKPNHDRGTDFKKVLSPAVVGEAVEKALQDAEAPIVQVMINGGNFPDRDKSFLHYANVVKAARKAIDKSGREVELHLIVFPPENLNLFSELSGVDVSVAINMEVFDKGVFEQVCPGKTKVAGQDTLFRALEKAVEHLGQGNVYSIMVGGLESLSTMKEGMNVIASMGAVPVINVFHADPETPLANHPHASADDIVEMGKALQNIYCKMDGLHPFYLDCGRNSLDTEAFRELF